MGNFWTKETQKISSFQEAVYLLFIFEAFKQSTLFDMKGANEMCYNLMFDCSV